MLVKDIDFFIYLRKIDSMNIIILILKYVFVIYLLKLFYIIELCYKKMKI